MSIETPEYAAMMRRMIRAHGRRVAQADPIDLADLAALREVLDEALGVAVAGLRAQGNSWAAIAEGLGVTRQTAWEAYRDAVDLAV